MTTNQSHKVFLHTTPKWEQFGCSKQFQSHFQWTLCTFWYKFKVLIVFLVENKQQDDSFHLFTIIKTNKTKTLFGVFSIEYIFLPQGD